MAGVPIEWEGNWGGGETERTVAERTPAARPLGVSGMGRLLCQCGGKSVERKGFKMKVPRRIMEH